MTDRRTAAFKGWDTRRLKAHQIEQAKKPAESIASSENRSIMTDVSGRTEMDVPRAKAGDVKTNAESSE